MKNDILLFVIMFAVAWFGYTAAKNRLMPTVTDAIVSEDGISDAMAAKAEMAAKAGMANMDAKTGMAAMTGIAAKAQMTETTADIKQSTDLESLPADEQQSLDEEPTNSSAASMTKEVASTSDTKAVDTKTAEAKTAKAKTAKAKTAETKAADTKTAETKAAETKVAETKSDKGEIEQILLEQTQAWNRGDLDAFMSAYWNDEALTFSGGGDTTVGWEATFASYRARYPEGEMGQIKFKNLKTEMVGKESAIVTGGFDHQLDDKKVRGNFSLVLKIVDGQWKIIHDHTSVAK